MSVENSLKRLGVDTIDLYYQHRQDKSKEPEEVCRVTAVQLRYSMMARWTQALFPMLEERHIGAVAYSPIANGFLSGKIQTADQYDSETDFRSFMPQYQKEEIEKSRELLNFIENMAKEKNATSAQISLAWMLCKKPYIVPIPGTTKTERILENAKAADITLTRKEIQEIDTRLDKMDLKVFGGM